MCGPAQRSGCRVVPVAPRCRLQGSRRTTSNRQSRHSCGAGHRSIGTECTSLGDCTAVNEHRTSRDREVRPQPSVCKGHRQGHQLRRLQRGANNGVRVILHCKNSAIADGRCCCATACGAAMKVTEWVPSHLHRSQLTISQKSKFGKYFLNSKRHTGEHFCFKLT